MEILGEQESIPGPRLAHLRINFPHAGYYRLVYWEMSKKYEVKGPFNTKKEAKNHPAFLGRVWLCNVEVGFYYDKPMGAED
jgi:hypothetical protein